MKELLIIRNKYSIISERGSNKFKGEVYGKELFRIYSKGQEEN